MALLKGDLEVVFRNKKNEAYNQLIVTMAAV